MASCLGSFFDAGEPNEASGHLHRSQPAPIFGHARHSIFNNHQSKTSTTTNVREESKSGSRIVMKSLIHKIKDKAHELKDKTHDMRDDKGSQPTEFPRTVSESMRSRKPSFLSV